MPFHRLPLAIFASASLATLALACGGISDPTKPSSTGGGETTISTVSGALSGTDVPSNAHVALVWRVASTGGWSVGSDAPVINGTFTMNLTAPPAEYFANFGEESSSTEPSSGSGGSAPSAGTENGPPPSDPSPSGAAGRLPAFNKGLAIRGTGVSGTVTGPLTAAVAGFIVYADANGNGTLDLTNPSGTTSDQILGGNRELVLGYLKGGSALDYEKQRDKTGVLPTEGFVLRWQEGERWLPLNLVDLKLDTKQRLPRAVCLTERDGADVAASPTGPTGDAPPSSGTYPDPSDPKLTCATDGRSYTYDQSSPCEPPPPAPASQGQSLCGGVQDETPRGCAFVPLTYVRLPDGPVPEGWPCPLEEAVDGGAAP